MGYILSGSQSRSLDSITGTLTKQKSKVDPKTGYLATAWEVHINDGEILREGYSGSPVVAIDSGLVIGVVTTKFSEGKVGEIIS